MSMNLQLTELPKNYYRVYTDRICRNETLEHFSTITLIRHWILFIKSWICS